MPSGYTADVQSGEVTELKDFALRCARAFGACIMQRDDNPKELPKEQEPFPYYQERIKETEFEIRHISRMTDDEILEHEKSVILKEIKQLEESIENDSLYNVRYNNMLEKVEKWIPPTGDHQNLKNFMVQQLKNSIQWDTAKEWHVEHLEREKWKLENLDTPENIRKAWISDLEKDLKYYQEKWDEEQQRVAERNEWIVELYKSLE